MSFARDRGVFESALEGVGVLGCRPLGCGGPAVRLPSSFPCDSSSFQCAHSPSQLRPVFHQGIGSDRCGGGSAREGSNQTCSPFSRLLQPPLCHPQSHRGLEACHQPLPSQPVCSSHPFSHGDSTVGPPVSASWGLDGFSGPEGRIPSGSGSSSLSPLPEILCRRGGLAISRSLFRPFDRPAGIHSFHGPDFVDYASSRVPDPEVPRQLARPQVIVSEPGSGEGFSPVALLGVQCPGQPGEELSDSHSDLDYLGMRLQTLPLRVFPTPKHVLKLASLLSDFTSCHLQPQALWRELLGIMSSLTSIMLGSRLRMRSLQLRLNSAGRRLPDSESLTWDSSCFEDLRRWSDESHILVGLPLGLSHPSLSLFTDALDSGWGGFPRRRPHVRLVISPLFQLFDKPLGAPCGPLRGSGVPSSSQVLVRQPVWLT